MQRHTVSLSIEIIGLKKQQRTINETNIHDAAKANNANALDIIYDQLR